MDFYLCQFGFEDVGLLRLLLTARHTGSQTTTCGNKRTNWDTSTSTIWSIWFVQHPFTFRVLSAFRCCPDNERKRSNNTKSDTAPRSLKNNAEDNCYKSSHRVWTGTCPYSCLFMGSGSVHNVQRMEWKNKNKCHLWNIHLPTRAQGDCGRTLALTHTHTHTGDLQARWGLKVWLRCLSKSADAEREESLLRASFFGWTRRGWAKASALWGMTSL